MKNLSILGIFVVDLAFFGRIPVKGETVMGEEFVTGPGGKGSNICLLLMIIIPA